MSQATLLLTVTDGRDMPGAARSRERRPQERVDREGPPRFALGSAWFVVVASSLAMLSCDGRAETASHAATGGAGAGGALPAETGGSGQSGVSGAVSSGGTLPAETGGSGQSGISGAVSSGGTLPAETGGSGQSGISGAASSGGTLPVATGGSGQSDVSGAGPSGGDAGGRSSMAGSGGRAPNAGAPALGGSNGGTATPGTGAQPDVGGAGARGGVDGGGGDDGVGGATAGGAGGGGGRDEWAEGEFRVCVVGEYDAHTRAKVYRYDAATASCVTLLLEAPGCSLRPGFLVDDSWCLADAMVLPNVESCDSTDPPITDPTPFLAESVTGSFSVSADYLLEADVALTFASGGPPDRTVKVSGCRLAGCGADDCRQ
ncbi:MAG: hypothetical protein JW940_05140 [Polyangiaceae bacterium]|nr:hypothetical protein [Polyangiaceae bacterium]